MEPALDTTNCSTGFDQFGDIQLKRALDVLQKENGQLRQLVVRLSETILRNVTAKVSCPSLVSPVPAINEPPSGTGGAMPGPMRYASKIRRARRM
jgi:hypothetical protein